MRLRPEECKKLATHAADLMLKDSTVTLRIKREALIDTIFNVLAHHFEQERQIDMKADALFKERSETLGQMDRGKAMAMIKKQLAQENDFVLSGGQEGRFSQDKLIHMAHIVDEKLFDDDLCDFKDEDEGAKFFKKVFMQYFGEENAVDERVRKKIASLANAPFEGSREWDVLFKKYREEELRRMNHT